MDCTFDLATNTLSAQPYGCASTSADHALKWRSREPLRLNFQRDGVDELLPAGSTITLYIVSAGTILASAQEWTEPESAAGVYEAEIILHTDALTNAFTDSAVSRISASIELHWHRDGEEATPCISDNAVTAAVIRPVVLPESSTPIVLDGAEEWLSARSVRYDIAQSLTTEQTIQALSNIGITGIASAAIMRGCLSIIGTDDTEYHLPLTAGAPPAL